MTSAGHGSLAGSFGTRSASSRGPTPFHSGGDVPRPCSGATISSGSPAPSTFAQRMRCSVGSEVMSRSVQLAPAAPGDAQWSVPPPFVSLGFQVAPRATSRRPSRSMSCGASVTLSFGVCPSSTTCACHDGFSNQTSCVPLIARMSGFLSPLTSATVTA